MVGIAEMTDAELKQMLIDYHPGSDCYSCACDELCFRERNPEYSIP